MKPAAFITGAANRIGKAMALHLARQGHPIALHYNNSKNAAEQTRQQILAMGVECALFQANLGNEQEVNQLAAEVFHSFQVGILINNASIFFPSNLFSEIETARSMFEINYWAPFLLTRAFASQYKQGLIINFLDSEITKRKTQHFDYLMSKKFLSNLTEMSAYQLAPGIRVNAIAPGPVLAPADKDQAYLEEVASQAPLKRPGSLEQLCKTLTYFMENTFITGQTIFEDGGKHLT